MVLQGGWGSQLAEAHRAHLSEVGHESRGEMGREKSLVCKVAKVVRVEFKDAETTVITVQVYIFGELVGAWICGFRLKQARDDVIAGTLTSTTVTNQSPTS